METAIVIMLVVLANIGIKISTGFDTLEETYTVACEGAGFEYHEWDDAEPNTYHCVSPKKED